MKEYQPSLFQLPDDELSNGVETLVVDTSRIVPPGPRSVDAVYLKERSEAALDQGWGWQPSEVDPSMDLTSDANEPNRSTAYSPDSEPEWQPPTAEEMDRVRKTIAATKAHLRSLNSV